MSPTFEEVEPLARLEIEMTLENKNLSRFIEHMNNVSTFDVPKMITNYFLEGVKYGLTIDPETSATELKLEMYKTHSKLSDSAEKDVIDKIFQEQFSELFSAVFVNGANWSVQHKLFNDEM